LIENVEDSVVVNINEHLGTSKDVLDTDIRHQIHLFLADLTVPNFILLVPYGAIVDITTVLAFFNPADFTIVLRGAVLVGALLDASWLDIDNAIAAIKLFPLHLP